MRFETAAVHAASSPDPTTGAILPPIYQTATYALEEVGRTKGFDYSRSANPTRQILEENLAVLEGGRYGVAFASGMAAVDAVFRLLAAGDHIICSDNVYGGVTRLLNEILKQFGVHVSYVDTSSTEEIQAAVRSNSRLIWVETPTNPLLKLTDLNAVGRIARETGLLFAVDSTFATPYLLRPLEFGADIVVHSTTKYLSGHNQVIGGICITNREELFERLKLIQRSVGAVPSPFDCWLTLLGVRTLPLRMERHCENALQVARFLEGHDAVEFVRYPGLTSHPHHALATRQYPKFGGMVSFELRGGIPAAVQFMNSLKLWALAESLGAVESMVTHPATMTHASVPPEIRHASGLSDGLVRLSVGIESVEDLIADLREALDAAESGKRCDAVALQGTGISTEIRV